jgi:hypothetical protein
MSLARQNKPSASLAALHRECRRVSSATSDAAVASFDHVLAVVNAMLQHSRDQFEPDTSAMLAIQMCWPQANTSTVFDQGQFLSSEVRRQLALYNKERLMASRNRRNTITVGSTLDAGGLNKKQTGGRLPQDLNLVTTMRGSLWQQVWQPVWAKVMDRLESQMMDTTLQAYLTSDEPCLQKHGLTVADIKSLQTLLAVELSFLRSQVWREALCSEFKLVKHTGKKTYEFRTSRSFKTAGRAASGSLTAATRWPLSEKQSAVVHTLLHLEDANARIFPGLSQHAASKVFARLGRNFCGVPRLGPHAMRTYYCYQAINDPDIGVADYPALASRLQVSVDTMTAVYAAPSMRAPAAQLAFRLHASDEKEQLDCSEPRQEKQLETEQQQQPRSIVQPSTLPQQQLQVVYVQQQQQQQQQQQLLQYSLHQPYAMPSMMPLWLSAGGLRCLPAPATSTLSTASPSVPYGRALSSLRLKCAPAIRNCFQSRGHSVEGRAPAAVQVAEVFAELCRQRTSSALPIDAAWFAFTVTYFADGHLKPFKDFVRKYVYSAQNGAAATKPAIDKAGVSNTNM